MKQRSGTASQDLSFELSLLVQVDKRSGKRGRSRQGKHEAKRGGRRAYGELAAATGREQRGASTLWAAEQQRPTGKQVDAKEPRSLPARAGDRTGVIARHT